MEAQNSTFSSSSQSDRRIYDLFLRHVILFLFVLCPCSTYYTFHVPTESAM